MTAKQYGRGQILRVDLTTERVTVEPIPDYLKNDYLGGEGINSRLLWEHFLRADPAIAPTSPENPIIAGVGLLGATGYGGGTKMKWTFKSPLTGFFGDSASGGTFGPNLRWAGYDHLIVTGKAKRPVYLWVHDDEVAIRDAGPLWGKNVHETDHAIKEDVGYADAEIACIGRTGENLVGFATLEVSGHRAAGRTGAGCVFGSKNLKAIVARGTRGLPIHDPLRFLAAADAFIARSNEARQRDAWKNSGTLSVYGFYNRMGFSPYRNNQYHAVPKDKLDLLTARWYLDNLAVSALACSPGCTTGCGGLYRIKGDESPAAREFAGETGYRTELAGQLGFGSVCDIPDLAAICHLWSTCCDHGVDVVELACCCGFLMELWQRGIIDAADTADWLGEPISLEWGSYRAVEQVVTSIALRRNRLGEIFKDGLYQAARRIEEIKGVPVLPYALYGKGGLSFVAEVRNDPSWATAFAVSSRGADHLKGAIATVARFVRPDIATREFGTPEAAAAFSPAMKGRDTARAEVRCAVVNSLGLCTFIVALDTVAFPTEMFAEALTAATGEPFTPDQIVAAARRTVNIEKAFNSRLGLRREDDRLCKRWSEEPIDFAGANGMKAADYLELTKDEYYAAHGWDQATSLPRRETLENLGMTDVAEVLASEGNLT